MRYLFGKEIEKYLNDKTYILVCDIGYGLFNTDKVINTGIAECATVGLAAGMAQEGLIPIIYTITPFLLERPFEFIKLDIVQQNVNVKLVSYGDYPEQGVTHYSTNVPDICKCLNIKLYYPKTIEECKENIKEMMTETIPSFTYLTKAKE